MSTKRKLSLSTPQPAKKERKAIDLATKMQVIKRYEGGKKVNAIARDLKLSHSTVSTILKDKERQRTGPIHEIAACLDGRSDPKTDTFKPFYCADEGSKSISLMSQMRRTELFREQRRLRGTLRARSVPCFANRPSADDCMMGRRR